MKTHEQIKAAQESIFAVMLNDGLLPSQRWILVGMVAALTFVESDDPDNALQRLVAGKYTIKTDKNEIDEADRNMVNFIKMVKENWL